MVSYGNYGEICLILRFFCIECIIGIEWDGYNFCIGLFDFVDFVVGDVWVVEDLWLF